MDKQQKHRNKEEEEEINVIDFVYLSHVHIGLNQLSQEHHKYSGTFKTQVKREKGIVK